VEGVKCRRQQPLGSYVVDFCSIDPKLVVEVDGGQHAERGPQDAVRTAYLERCGYRVLRFWNNEVLQQTEAVVEQIAGEVRRLSERINKGEKRTSYPLT